MRRVTTESGATVKGLERIQGRPRTRVRNFIGMGREENAETIRGGAGRRGRSGAGRPRNADGSRRGVGSRWRLGRKVEVAGRAMRGRE